MGIIAPDRNICGMVISMTARLAILLLLISPITIMASAPADRHMSGDSARTARICETGSVMPMTSPTTRVPIRLTIAPKLEPIIFPITMEYRETGEIIISWVKSVKWSSTSEEMPDVVDINSMLTSMPTSMNLP